MAFPGDAGNAQHMGQRALKTLPRLSSHQNPARPAGPAACLGSLLPACFHPYRCYRFSSSRKLSKFPFSDLLQQGLVNILGEGVDDKYCKALQAFHSLTLRLDPAPATQEQFTQIGSRLDLTHGRSLPTPILEKLAECLMILHLTSSCHESTGSGIQNGHLHSDFVWS